MGINRTENRRMPTDRCERCGDPIVQPATGRRRRYCSDACRQSAFVYRRRSEAVQDAAAEARRSTFRDAYSGAYAYLVAPLQPLLDELESLLEDPALVAATGSIKSARPVLHRAQALATVARDIAATPLEPLLESLDEYGRRLPSNVEDL